MDKQNLKSKAESIIKRVRTHGNNFVLMCRENKKVAGIVAAFLVIVVVAVIAAVKLDKRSEAAAAVAAEESQGEAAETTESGIVVPEEALEQDAYPEVNNLIKQYYQALVDGDVETIRTLKNYSDEKEEIKIVKKSEYIESYPSITVYTKKGPEENSFVAYVYYEVKFLDYEETAPGLNTLYICANDDGSYYINDNELDESVIEYLKAISAQNDVIDLFNTVQVQYNEVKTSDEELSAFLDELPDLLSESVSVAMAELEGEDETEEEEEAQPQEVEVVTKVKTTSVVNVRSSDSVEADKLGQTTSGQVLELLEEKVNGWSKVNFDGKEGYIKSEFLEPEETTMVTVTPDADEESADESEETTTAAATTTDSETTTKGKVTDTVNIRQTPSTDGTKLGQIYKGTEIEIIEKQTDGWTKIKYNGSEAYVKSEYVE
jgi:uncharacterized protein YgiM (DUF1202 family)